MAGNSQGSVRETTLPFVVRVGWRKLIIRGDNAEVNVRPISFFVSFFFFTVEWGVFISLMKQDYLKYHPVSLISIMEKKVSNIINVYSDKQVYHMFLYEIRMNI